MIFNSKIVFAFFVSFILFIVFRSFVPFVIRFIRDHFIFDRGRHHV